MERQKFELFFTLGSIFLFSLGLAMGFIAIPWLGKEQLILVIAASILALMVVSLFISIFFQSYIVNTKRLAEGMKVIATVNPSWRTDVDGPQEMRALAEAINQFAQRYQSAQENQAAEIERAHNELNAEKQRLAALMSELTEGVLVCNIEGQILLYNKLAKDLLSVPPERWTSSSAAGLVGLGRSIFGVLDRSVITHALEEIIYRTEKHSAQITSRFVTSATNGQLLRVSIAPILQNRNTINGFILTLEDTTQHSQSSARRDILLRALTEGIRSPIANIRAAIETIESYPNIQATKLSQLYHVISEESLALSGQLDELTTEYASDIRAKWQLEKILGSDLLWAIQRRFEDKLDVKTDTIAEANPSLWLQVDGYLIIQAATNLARRLKEDFQIARVQINVKQIGRLAALDIIWESAFTDTDTMWSWQNRLLDAGSNSVSMTLREIAEYHGGEVWCQRDADTDTAYFRMLLPTTEAPPVRRILTAQGSRPEYYDFDLFQSANRTSSLQARALTDLTYSVFDTETTGLDPVVDEIISIGAARIVNARLLRQEIFDQMVDPRRAVPAAASKIHGISTDMLDGHPTIEQVLPAFHHFVEDTVLVGHNAAFDMRLFQQKEGRTHLRFSQPVLDTLLLSAVIHPSQQDHSLEAIADRLGIDIVGRHTALGDALVTGDIFLKMIPLLAERGIISLADALEAAKETFYARLKY